MIKQKLFYTPLYQTMFHCPDVDVITKQVDDDIFEKFETASARKGARTEVQRIDECKHDEQSQLINHINQLVYSVESGVEAFDYEWNIAYKGTYQTLSNNCTGLERFTALYVLDVDDEYSEYTSGRGEYRLLNPNAYAHPLYQPTDIRKGTLLVMPSQVLFEMLPYQSDVPRYSLLINYTAKDVTTW